MVEHKKIIFKLEQQALSSDNYHILNHWMVEVTNAQHNVMMSVTEKANSKTLRSLVVGYELGEPDRKYSRLETLSLVRREVERQQKVKLLRVEKFMTKYLNIN